MYCRPATSLMLLAGLACLLVAAPRLAAAQSCDPMGLMACNVFGPTGCPNGCQDAIDATSKQCLDTYLRVAMNADQLSARCNTNKLPSTTAPTPPASDLEKLLECWPKFEQMLAVCPDNWYSSTSCPPACKSAFANTTLCHGWMAQNTQGGANTFNQIKMICSSSASAIRASVTIVAAVIAAAVMWI